jgi:hypothetical protein
MIVWVTKKVPVEVNKPDIDAARKAGGPLLNTGMLADDMNLTYVIANNRAAELIGIHSKEVQTETSLDDQIDVKAVGGGS